jgi:hypothetical protein
MHALHPGARAAAPLTGDGEAAGVRGAGEQPAQEQLPGDRPARLGQRADQLQRPADRPGGLLQYLVSFRNHNEFHEQCVERIFMDIWTRCKPIKLAVYARYTRRGGLDINPFRTSHPQALPANSIPPISLAIERIARSFEPVFPGAPFIGRDALQDLES